MDREATLELVTGTFDAEPTVVAGFFQQLFEWKQGSHVAVLGPGALHPD